MPGAACARRWRGSTATGSSGWNEGLAIQDLALAHDLLRPGLGSIIPELGMKKMSDSVTDLPLASEFPPATREQWLKLVDGVLKGAPFDKKLVGKTYDGLEIEPLYPRRADADVLAARAPSAPWQIMARVDHPDPVQANKQALEDLEGGASGLVLVCPGSVGAQGFGIDTSAEGIAKILDGVYLDAGAPIEFTLTREAKDAPSYVAALVKSRGLDPASVDLRVGFDPIGLMACGSSSPMPWPQVAPLVCADDARLCRSGISRTIRGRRCARDPQCRRLGGAGAGLRARDRARLLARAGGRRRLARRCAADDLLPAVGRCRPVHDHGEIPRACGNYGRAWKKPRASRRSLLSSPPKPRGG